MEELVSLRSKDIRATVLQGLKEKNANMVGGG
jgi:hypothetical protein